MNGLRQLRSYRSTDGDARRKTRGYKIQALIDRDGESANLTRMKRADDGNAQNATDQTTENSALIAVRVNKIRTISAQNNREATCAARIGIRNITGGKPFRPDFFLMGVDQDNAGVQPLGALRLTENFNMAFNAAHAATVY